MADMRGQKTGVIVWACPENGSQPSEAYFLPLSPIWEADDAGPKKLSYLLAGLLADGYLIVRVRELYDTDGDLDSPDECYQ